LPTHPAEHIGQRRADREDQHHLDEIGERIGILVRMRRIGIEEAAAIGAIILMTSCEATGPWAITCLAPSSVVA
jgi:hypothetical protein